MLGLHRTTATPFAALALALGCLAPPAQASLPPCAPRAVETSAAAATVTSVLAVSVDGLNPRAIRELGRERAPVLHRLVRRGASTMNARTEREKTETLPNHTGMVTGRRITAARGGHGVTWNDERLEPATVQEAAGHHVRSVFGKVHTSEHRTALFASKEKFRLFERSWDPAIDRFVVRADNRLLVRKLRADLRERNRTFRFLHLSRPDVVGHASGFMSPAYLDAVADVDRMLGRILKTVGNDPQLAGRLALVLTADHGGEGSGHSDPTVLANYRVPFVVWGPGVARGADLYDLNPDYRDPGRKRTRYAAERQPVRNGDLANLVTDLLGLGPLDGSEHDADQDLDVG